ncbi:MAG: isochorismate synthase [Acidimicrobiales bacterium]
MTRLETDSLRLDGVASDELHAESRIVPGGDAKALEDLAFALCMATAQESLRNAEPSPFNHSVLFRSRKRLMIGLGAARVFPIAGGSADSSAVQKVARSISEISCVDRVNRPGSKPVAFGALRFVPTEPSELVVPELTFVRDADGTSWITVVGIGDLGDVDQLLRERAAVLKESRTAGAPGELPVVGGEAEYTEAVTGALRAIAERRVEKVVISRRAEVILDTPVDVRATVEALIERESSSTIFCFASSAGVFVGASPELLVGRYDAEVDSLPLAGTVRKSGVAATDEAAIFEMVRSKKENHEHRLVVDDVAKTLARWCDPLEVPAEPEVLVLRDVAHLATRLKGTIDGDPVGRPSVLELTAALHPTPAVGGSPTDEALALIADLEPHGRGLFAGPVGWVDAKGDGEFFIGIRSAQLVGNHAYVYAGCGIVSGSDPGEELAETTSKLATMRGSLTAT